jgi:hypothetical protein
MAITGSPTNLNLNDAVPPAPPGAVNIGFQAGLPYPDPNDATQLVRDADGYYFPAPVGGDLILTDDYQLSDVDSGFTIIANSATPITITFPPAPPSLNSGQGVWRVKIKNFGSGLVTIDPNGPNLDGSAATRTLTQGAGFEVSTDATDYWTFANFGPAPPTILSVPATANPGPFQIAHGLGRAPSAVSIVATSDGFIRLNAPKFDATYVYLSASDGGLTCDLLLW